MPDRPFAGQNAVVSGASGAIGGAIARELGRRGARVLLLGRDAGRLGRALDDLRHLGGDGLTHAGDLGRDDAWPALEHALATLGGVDVLVHAQGHFASGSLHDAPIEEIDRLFRVNFRSPLLLTRLCLPSLIAQQGQVAFVNSSAATRTAAGNAGAYAASKQLLRAAADGLRDEVNPRGVRVVTVFPGRTASAMQREASRQLDRPYEPDRLLEPADVAAVVIDALALPRSAEVTDLHVRPMHGSEKW